MSKGNAFVVPPQKMIACQLTTKNAIVEGAENLEAVGGKARVYDVTKVEKGCDRNHVHVNVVRNGDRASWCYDRFAEILAV